MEKPAREKAYMRVYESLRDGIIKGRLPFGKKLPGKRQLAADYNVSIITVQHALELLSEEGYIRTKERSGSYAIYESSDMFTAEKSFADGALNLPEEPEEREEGGAIEGLPFSVYARTVRRVLTEWGGEIMEKSPGMGTLRLRDAISSYLYENRGISAEIDQIVIGSGAEYLYGILVQVLGRRLTYGIESPSYEKIKQVYSSSGVKVLDLELGPEGIKTEELKKEDFDILHISPYRSYPTGVRAGASKRREYLAWALERPGRFIIEDDFESEFNPSAKPAETLFSEGEGKNIIYLNTFSRTVGPSVRTGYMVLPKELTEIYKEKAGYNSCSVPVLEQYTLAMLMESGDFVRHINRIRRARKNRSR